MHEWEPSDTSNESFSIAKAPRQQNTDKNPSVRPQNVSHKSTVIYASLWQPRIGLVLGLGSGQIGSKNEVGRDLPHCYSERLSIMVLMIIVVVTVVEQVAVQRAG